MCIQSFQSRPLHYACLATDTKENLFSVLLKVEGGTIFRFDSANNWIRPTYNNSSSSNLHKLGVQEEWFDHLVHTSDSSAWQHTYVRRAGC